MDQYHAEKKRIFKQSWARDRWIRAALACTHNVQLAAPELPLDRAGRFWVRNNRTRVMLRQMGFPDPEVRRVRV